MLLECWFPRDLKKTHNLCGLYSSKTSNKSNMSGVKSKTDWINPRSEMKETLQTSFVRSSVSQNCKTTNHPSFLQRDAQATTQCEQKVKKFLISSWIWDGSWRFSSLHWVTAGSQDWSQFQKSFTANPWSTALRKLWNASVRLSLRKECRIQYTVIPFCSISLSGYQQLPQRFNLVHWSENTLGKRTL